MPVPGQSGDPHDPPPPAGPLHRRIPRLTWLNRLAYIAVDREILRCNPLEDLPYEKKVPPRHRAISREDLQRLLTHPQADPRLELIRRMFLFSCLTGLAYADMQSLYPRHIGQTAEGRSYIRKQRVKTRI